MKYIDAEELKARIIELSSGYWVGDEYEYYEIAKGDVLDIIDSLQQEQPEVDDNVFNTLVSLGYPCDTNGDIPNYVQTFEACKSAMVYWLQGEVQKMLAAKRINTGGIITKTLFQAYREGIEDTIKKLSSQCNQEQSEVDLEKEIKEEIAKWGDFVDIGFAAQYDARPFDGRDIDRIAHHFYELGLKARKE